MQPDRSVKRTPARIVDGGYFENSGMETAIDVVESLRDFYIERKPGETKPIEPLVKIYVMIISSFQLLQTPKFDRFGELLSPISAMLSTRESRASLALMRMYSVYERCKVEIECGERIYAVPFYLNLYDFDLPLGWLLAPSTRKIVGLHSGLASKSDGALGDMMDPDPISRISSYAARANSAACEIEAILTLGEEPKNACLSQQLKAR
jgi:hypothetical protein